MSSQAPRQQQKRLVVLISGSGTNLQAIIDGIADGTIPNTTISAVISNRPHVGGLARAAAAGIKTETLDHTQYHCREAYDRALVKMVQQHQPDYIILAGFMRILTQHFIETFLGKTVNIHPSLLPNHKGLHTHRAVYQQRDQKHGCSVHFVTLDLDSGPIIGQASFDVQDTLFHLSENDAIESLRREVQRLEHQLYPTCVQWLVGDRLYWDPEKNRLLFDGQLIDQPISASH